MSGPARPRHRVVVRRDRASRWSRTAGGSARNVVASQVALHAASGGIVPEVAARAHLRWIVPVLDEAWADAGRRRGTTSTRRGDLRARAWPARCWSGSTSPRRWPGSTTSRWSASTTSRATSTPRGCSTRARPDARRAGLPARRARRLGRPHVPRRDARPPDLPAARHDRRRRRRRGVRQGRPAARASATRAGPAIGRAADAARRAATAVFPRAWLGRLVRLQLLRAQDRRPADRRRGARADEGLAGRRRTRRCRDAVVGGARVGVPGRRGRRPGDQDDPGGRARSARARSCSGGGVAANGVAARPAGRRGRGAGRPAHRAAARRCARTTGR